MSKKSLGIVLLALTSFAVGLGSAQAFFRLFQSTVPPVALGSFQIGAAHAAFLVYGAVLGIVIFGLGIVICLVHPLFRSAAKAPVPGSASGNSAAPRG